MRDGVDHAAIDEAEPRRREARRDAIPIRTIDIKVHRRAAIARRALFVDERYRHRRALARRPVNQFGFLLVLRITGWHLLHLQRLDRDSVRLGKSVSRSGALWGRPILIKKKKNKKTK